MTTLAAFLSAMTAAHAGVLPLNVDQRQAIDHGFAAPLWIIAGPGTGKTHTLCWLVWKRILVDGVAPDRIFLTTFTRKAATELQTRLLRNQRLLVEGGLVAAGAVDATKLHIGTLHSLCARVLQDERYEPTLRVRVLEDELTQAFFVRQSRNSLMQNNDLAFWQRFGMLGRNGNFAPPASGKASNACKLFNRMTENQIGAQALKDSGDAELITLGNAYAAYQQALQERHRTDQANLQKHFLDFLSTRLGAKWLGGGLTVLVDEYQDTNPIQEAIYFKLAGGTRDLTVVGDDDQSLYRFRGATVESLVSFDKACAGYFGRSARSPKPVYLRENRRSHKDIVRWVNRFISTHPEMKGPAGVRVRAPGKPKLKVASGIRGKYPAVSAIIGSSNPVAGKKLASAVQSLSVDGLITDWSQIALLTFSTRETTHGISAYTDALRALKIPVHNPRSRRAHRDELLLALVGALSSIVDEDWDPEANLPWPLGRGVRKYVGDARAAYDRLAKAPLKAYVAASQKAIRASSFDDSTPFNYLERSGGRRVTLTGLLYKLLGHRPFVDQFDLEEGSGRVQTLNGVLAEFDGIFEDGELRLERKNGRVQVNRGVRHRIYSVFVDGVASGLNDPEDDEVSIKPGAVNVMTIHQSKGLQFEVVFVLRPDKQPFLSDTHVVEDVLWDFVQRPTKPKRRRAAAERAAEDAIRLFFVAFSRPKRLLGIVGTSPAKWGRVMGVNAAGKLIETKAAVEAEVGLCL